MESVQMGGESVPHHLVEKVMLLNWNHSLPPLYLQTEVNLIKLAFVRK